MKIVINDCYGGFSVSQLVIDKFRELTGESLYSHGFDDHRDNPILIKLVKELGKEANGKCAELKIIEIPDGVDWTIAEYDGIEWIAEKHRTWK